MTSAWKTLQALRDLCGDRKTQGLDDESLAPFLAADADLQAAVAEALTKAEQLLAVTPELAMADENELCAALQGDYLNFYGDSARSPYVPLAARGPWIVTLHGAVLHDSGGYGMLGLGHAPAAVVDALAQPWVMANVMTPSLSQKRFADLLRAEIGHTRGGCPYSRFLCLNSGSESVTMAARITDLHAYRQTQPGAPHAGHQIRYLSLAGGFHGRTDPAARISGSTLATYQGNLASFRDRDQLTLVEPNDLQGLTEVYAAAAAQGVFFEGFFIEPVMGEGEPGLGLTPEFYALARQLADEHGSLLVCDSIQAGFRATGHLSIVDYPGFQGLPAPDLETFSKALNAGQYPLSVLALSPEAAALYVTGIYGNTMTTCPRGLEVGCAVLEAVTDDLRANIRERGTQLKDQLEALAEEFGDGVLGVQGTGLMVNIELDPRRFPVCGPGGLEEGLRRRGIHMIHGGHNGLRFTPHFGITSAQVALIVAGVRGELQARALAEQATG
ncbi:MAG TPA: aminotransferase class III-fold pyridoxal phosphate-dependent enzyme [Candidatus Krumholzibacteria bacterium]|nr:aminotransferase class III-fold pyridoxal phosphate-dependent enzyme [Candidatus Krumholzibacteria bacterium]